MDWQHHPWAGVFPATLCSVHKDESIDEEGLANYMRELANTDDIKVEVNKIRENLKSIGYE